MVRLLPIKWQARVWWHFHRYRSGWTSHYRINAMKSLRNSAKIPLKEAQRLIDEVSK